MNILLLLYIIISKNIENSFLNNKSLFLMDQPTKLYCKKQNNFEHPYYYWLCARFNKYYCLYAGLIIAGCVPGLIIASCVIIIGCMPGLSELLAVCLVLIIVGCLLGSSESLGVFKVVCQLMKELKMHCF